MCFQLWRLLKLVEIYENFASRPNYSMVGHGWDDKAREGCEVVGHPFFGNYDRIEREVQGCSGFVEGEVVVRVLSDDTLAYGFQDFI